MKIATWNINSIRLRKENILKFLKEEKIDIICLQETKTINDNFPLSFFFNAGYVHVYMRGEKSYNGVAIISKVPIIKKTYHNFCNLNDARHIEVLLNNNITLHNFYIPAGGELANIDKNLKFKHKINFINEMIKKFKKDNTKSRILLGDFNIAPLENDVWSHKQLINVVSHTKIEVDYFNMLIDSGPFIDIIREFYKPQEKVFTWWSYRSKDWSKSNKGRRLDHVLVCKKLKGLTKEAKIYKNIRDVNNPSDHVPISITLNVK